MVSKFFNSALSRYVIAIIYGFLFYKGYILFLNYYFEYAYFRIINGRLEDYFLLFLTFIFIIIPLFFYRGVINISSFISIFIYFFLYVPIIITYYFNMEGDNLYVIYQQMLFIFGMSLLFFADKIPISRSIKFPSKINVFKFAAIVSCLLTIIVAIIYRSNLRFVGFDDVYEQRMANKMYNTNAFISYSIAWLSNVFVPLCLAYGLFFKKRLYFIIGCLGALIVYMGTAQKSVFLFPLICYLLYRFLNKRSLKQSFNYIGLGLIVIMSISLLFDFNIYSSILWYRTLGNGGLLSTYYHEFFLSNPNTYYSHVNFINVFTNSYPYDKSIGETVGHVYWGESNANANFWATDGYAAYGDGGVIISSILMFLIFIFLNRVFKGYNLLFSILVLIPYIMSITNTSLFQSLFSGGALIIAFILSFNNKFKIN